MKTKGLILAGGEGTRLHPITSQYPKQLLPILGKPILLYVIDFLTKAGIDEIGIVLNPKTSAVIESELKSHNIKAKIEYIYQEKALGLAHALKTAEPYLKDANEIVMVLGDNIFNKDLTEMLNTYRVSKADTLLLLKEVSNAYQFGVAKFDATGKVQKLVEKPKVFVSNYAIVGAYIFNQTIFTAINKTKPSGRGELEITDSISQQVEDGCNIQVDFLNDYWFDTGTREGLLDANKKLLLRYGPKLKSNLKNAKNVTLIGDVYCGEGVEINNTTIMGPVFIGDNCKLRDAIIGPFTSISNSSEINGSELMESIIMKNCLIDHSRIISSVIFEKSKISQQGETLNSVIG